MIIKPITAQLFRKDVDEFCKKYDLSRREVGVKALNDSAFFLRLQQEKSPTLARVERVYDFMIEYEKTHTADG
jgi:hypothetical protein